jgi:hypothetical protein
MLTLKYFEIRQAFSGYKSPLRLKQLDWLITKCPALMFVMTMIHWRRISFALKFVKGASNAPWYTFLNPLQVILPRLFISLENCEATHGHVHNGTTCGRRIGVSIGIVVCKSAAYLQVFWDKLHEDEDDGAVTQARMTPVAPLNAMTEVKNSVLETVPWTTLGGRVAIIRRVTCGRMVATRRWAALGGNILVVCWCEGAGGSRESLCNRCGSTRMIGRFTCVQLMNKNRATVEYKWSENYMLMQVLSRLIHMTWFYFAAVSRLVYVTPRGWNGGVTLLRRLVACLVRSGQAINPLNFPMGMQ